jgi:OOP family OmpA-OmpF porin
MSRSIAILSFFVCLPALAGTGPYLALGGGANLLPEQALRSEGGDIGELRFDNGYVGSLAFGGTFAFGLRPELELAYRRNEIKSIYAEALGMRVPAEGTLEAYTAMLNLMYEIRTSQGFFSVVHPYIGGGAGVAHLAYRDPSFGGTPGEDDSQTVFAFQGGAGVGFDLSDSITLSLDYRHVRSGDAEFELDAIGPPIEASYRANTALASLRFSFGVASAERPETRKPALRRTNLPPPPPDADGDGTPDSLDKCSKTPPGFKVDITGCIVQQSVVLQAVDFEPASTRLTAPSRQTLDMIAAALREQPDLKIEVGGHTDSQGSREANLKVSRQRADVVVKYLVNAGVPRTSLVAKGYGSSRPVADNATEEGRTQNRRVEFKVLSKPASVKVIQQPASDETYRAAQPRRIPDAKRVLPPEEPDGSSPADPAPR